MDKVKAYEALKKELEDGDITQKGFDVKVKKLLAADKSDDRNLDGAKAFLSAAEAFGQAKKLVQAQVKKRQFPLCKKGVDSEKSQIKIRMAPMEWRPRTKTRSGRYQKIIMEECPPRILLEGHETWDDLVNIGKARFWSQEDEESQFTLCYSDGTRWSREDFHKEYKTVSEIPSPWKRTFYIGRRELEVICVGERSCASGSDEITEADISDQDFHLGSSCSAELETGNSREKKHFMSHVQESVGSFAGTGAAIRQEEGSEELAVGASHTGHGFISSTNRTPVVPTSYLPRVPYVEREMIKYSEENLVGEGTFGKVYRGSFHGTPAAIKQIVIGATETEKDIQHEINVLLRLSHPNIVRLMAAARSDACFWLASEYIHGATLAAVLHTENCIVKLSGEDASFISLDLSMAVEYIHAQRIIHQDIKPANVLVHHPSKRAALTDWGLANIRDTVMLRRGSRFIAEAVGPTGGTFLYMAPECALHFEEASWHTDMWSLGATYLELLTGSVPWETKKQRELSALMAAKSSPHALRLLDERFAFLGSLMSYDPSSRPTASAVVEFLKSQLDLQSRYGFNW